MESGIFLTFILMIFLTYISHTGMVRARKSGDFHCYYTFIITFIYNYAASYNKIKEIKDMYITVEEVEFKEED